MYRFVMIILAGFLALGPVSCGEAGTTSPPMRFTDAVVIATSGGETSESPVAGNYVISPDGERSQYGGSTSLQQGAVDVSYAFVGRGDHWVPDTDPRETVQGDVYLFNIETDDATVTLPVLYTGERNTIYTEDGLEIIMKPIAP